MLHRRGFYLGTLFQDAAARHGEVTVTLDRPLDVAPQAGVEHTYGTIADLVDDLAARLRAAGVGAGDLVAVHKDDNVDIVLLTCALSRIAAVPALLSPTLSPNVVSALLRRMDRPWLLTDHTKLVGELAAPQDLARTVLTVGAESARTAAAIGGVALEAFTGAARRPAMQPHPLAPALITHSSGTTGLPKLAVHCPRTMWNRLVPQQILGWPSRGEVAALCMSYVHSRFYHALGVMLKYGSPLLLLVDHDPEAVAPLMGRVRPGIVETHPNTFVLWEDLADDPRAPLSNVSVFGSTFDAIHPRTIKRLLGASRRRSPKLMQLYGQSETGPVTARFFTRRNVARASGRLVGFGLPAFTRVRVVDDAGRRCAPDVAGHIEARTRGRILSYLGAQDTYDGQLTEGWWRMGDMGYRSRWGGLHLIDREIDQIDNVDSNLEIEDILMSRLTELREVVVVPGRSGEPVPVVCTRADRPLDQQRWRNAVADLPPMTGPVVCRFDDLPRTGTWKIKRVEITRMFQESQALAQNWLAS